MEILRNFKDVSPRPITILWGYNDVNQSKPIWEVIPIYDSFVDSLCSKFPDAANYCIFQTFTTTVLDRNNAESRIDSLPNSMRATVETLQKTHNNLYLIDGATYETSEAYLKDQGHLIVQEAKKLADGIVTGCKAHTGKYFLLSTEF